MLLNLQQKTEGGEEVDNPSDFFFPEPIVLGFGVLVFVWGFFLFQGKFSGFDAC